MFNVKTISCLSFLCVLLVNADPEVEFPHNLQREYSKFYAPAKIISSEAKFFNFSTPLKITMPLHDRMTVTNTGTTIRAVLSEPSKRFTITGGLLKSEVYDFAQIIFSWNQVFTDFTGNSLDNTGTALRPFPIFYNRKYQSLENAKQYTDGVVGVMIKVDVEGVVPNTRFGPFEKVLHSMMNAGSSEETTVESVFSWVFGAKALDSYYAYPGSYHSTGNTENRKYYHAISIELPKSQMPSISIEQFEAFNQLKNQHGFPVESRVSSFPMGDRPLIQAPGLVYVPLV